MRLPVNHIGIYMRYLLSTAALAIATFAAPFAVADTSINTSAFGLSISDIYWTTGSLQVLSDDGKTIRIGIGGAEPLINPVISQAPELWEYSNGDFGFARLGGALLPGYRINSMTLSGTLSGSIDIEEPTCSRCTPSMPGSGGNEARIIWTADNGSGEIALPESRFTDIEGKVNYSATAATQLQGDFALNINTVLTAWSRNPAYSSTNPWNFDPIFGVTTASIKMTDMVLTVQVSAVPEPATYGMLLGGMGVLLAAARRRKA